MSATKGPAPTDGRERRRWSRYAVTAGFPAELVTDDGRIACRIENVSLAGARLRLSRRVHPSAQVSLDCGGERGPIGRCVWAEAECLGVTFKVSDRSVDLTLACIRHGLPTTASSDRPR
ncbi:MAG: PilZ domain-containing protein [Kiloniellales bacterium]|nr:PilZ domain-containing protein [Kiloniellales bacterium]